MTAESIIYLFIGLFSGFMSGIFGIGARIGSKASLKTRSTWLEGGLAILVVVLAFVIIYKEL